MDLIAAYTKLGLKPPWKFETDSTSILKSLFASEEELRRTGATTHMLIELYLDLQKATVALGLPNRHRISFMVITRDLAQVPTLRGTLRSIHSRLDLKVDISKVDFVPMGSNPDRFRGWRIPSWGIFCDHYAKEMDGIERLQAPWSSVRKVTRVDQDVFQGFDRDGRLLGLTTRNGIRVLLEGTQFPITADFLNLNPKLKISAVTYPAWSHEPLRSAIDLKGAFEL
jgi:hypothetical protein